MRKIKGKKPKDIVIAILLFAGVLCIIMSLIFLGVSSQKETIKKSHEYGDIFYKYKDVDNRETNLVLSSKEKEVSYDFSIETNSTLSRIDYTFYLNLKSEFSKETLDSVSISLKEINNSKAETIIKETPLSDLDKNNDLLSIYETSSSKKELKTYRLKLWSSKETLTDDITIELLTKLSTGETLPAVAEDSLSYKVMKDRGNSCVLRYEKEGVYLAGGCNNNYLSFSGILYRPYLIENKTNGMKMITEQTLSATMYQEKKNAFYENSYLEAWINDQFFPLLDSKYLNQVELDVSTFLNPNKPISDKKLESLAGVMSFTEVNKTKNDLYKDWYLHNNTQWWLSNSKNNNGVYQVSRNERVSSSVPTLTSGIRPVINLKSNVSSKTGTGTEKDPYLISEIATKGDLLSTRKSGEFVKLGEELYQIIKVQNDLTKVISNSNIEEIGKQAFGSTNTDNIYNISSGIGQYLNNTWYHSLKEKSMLAENAFGNGITVGLPVYQELFTGFGLYTKNDISSQYWTMTTLDNGKIYYYSRNSQVEKILPTAGLGVRTTFYLNKNIKIISGTGTYDDPFIIDNI